MLESSVEAGLRKQVVKRGGMFLKFVSPSQSGVPDRIIIDQGRVIFVELKQQGAKPRKLQQKMIERMRDHGADVRVVAGKAEADALVKELWEKEARIHLSMKPTTTPAPGWVRQYYVQEGARRAGKRYAMEIRMEMQERHRYPPEDGRGRPIYEDESVIREEDDDGV